MSSQVSRATPEADTIVASPTSEETSSEETLQPDSTMVSSIPEASTASEETSTLISDSSLPVDPLDAEGVFTHQSDSSLPVDTIDAEGVPLSTRQPGSSVPADFLRNA